MKTTSLPDHFNACIIRRYWNTVCQFWTCFCYLSLTLESLWLKRGKDTSRQAQVIYLLIAFHWLPLENSTLWGCQSERVGGLNHACVPSLWISKCSQKYSQKLNMKWVTCFFFFFFWRSRACTGLRKIRPIQFCMCVDSGVSHIMDANVIGKHVPFIPLGYYQW